MKCKTIVFVSGMLASAILLTACGGGGGSMSSSPSGGTAAPAATVGGTVAGVAAKGILANAIVTAYCGNSEAAADQLAAATTDAAGKFSLTWTTACAKLVKLVVTAGVNTTTADEATGTNVSLPAGFRLRALIADPDITAIKNITPLTDMAAAIAGTSATLSKTAASNAEAAIIKNVLGGDIGAYEATPLAPIAAAMATASPDEKKLATLLTAISAFAQDSTTAAACGALTGGNGARIQCAVDAFGAQAAATVTAVSDAGYTVASIVPANTPATMLANTLAKIKIENASGMTGGIISAAGPRALSSVITSDTSGSAALLTSAKTSVLAAASSGGAVALTAPSGVQAARDLFNSLKNDLLALSNGSGTGYLDKKIEDLNTDWTTNGLVSVTGFSDYMTAIGRAADLAYDARNLAAPSSNGLVANAAYPVSGHSDLFLITDVTGAASQIVRQFAGYIGTDHQALSMSCRVNVSEMSLGKATCGYGYGKVSLTDSVAGNFTSYSHGVRVSESAPSSGTYTWQDYFSSRVFSLTQRYVTPAGSVFVPVVQTSTSFFGTPFSFVTTISYTNFAVPLAAPVEGTALTGTATVTRDSSGKATAVTLKGDIQPLATGQDKSTLDVSGALSSISASTTGTTTTTTEVGRVSGTVTNVKGTATTLSMALMSGSQLVHQKVQTIATGATSEHMISGKFITQTKTAAFQYDGTVAADSFAADKKGGFIPTNMSFSGKISTLSNGTPTEFLSGTLGAVVSSAVVAAYDPSLPDSVTNWLKPTVTFSGKATNGSTTYELTSIVDGSTYGQATATLNYSRTASQMVSVVIAATGTNTPSVSTTVSVKGSGNVNAVITNGIGDVNTGTTKVGAITKNPGQVTFTDGTFLLLGI
jgi:hypothetical protein